MATKRHMHTAFVLILGLMLVCPPLTGAIAAGFGLDLAHHHCGDHGVETLSAHAEDGHGPAGAHDHAGTGDHDPFQCDQCNIAFVALPADTVPHLHNILTPPAAQDVLRLLAADPPLAFKPPIA